MHLIISNYDVINMLFQIIVSSSVASYHNYNNIPLIYGEFVFWGTKICYSINDQGVISVPTKCRSLKANPG